MFKHYSYIVVLAVLLYASACSPAGGNKRGHEFMPDMVHSTAYEANLYNYYYYNTWGSEEEYKTYAEPRLPVEGTIARGYVGVSGKPDAGSRAKAVKEVAMGPNANAQTITVNGSVPYYYEDTEEERTRAIAEITANPFPITEAGLLKGQELYLVYCGICHGAKGDGLGYLVREADPARGITAGVYPAQPANLIQDEFIQASEGRYYHSIMYGKNVMGSYADKLSYEERWQVIHYIRSLQAKEKGLVYSADENTLNASAVPGNTIVMNDETHQDTDQSHETMEGEGHSDDHGDGTMQEGEGHQNVEHEEEHH